MQSSRPRILLAEDDLHLGILLVDFLQTEGFEVTHCKDGLVALKTFHVHRFDLCLLDIMMPQLDGFALASAIRAQDSKIPIIFITAKGLKADKWKGYGLGADDYITKPFDEEELLWKIKAFLKRNVPVSSNPPSVKPEPLGQYLFDYTNQSLTYAGKLKRITEKESDILAYLISRRNTLVKREELLVALWGENDYFLGRSLDVFITKLRKYLKEDSGIKIETVFGVGFILRVGEST